MQNFIAENMKSIALDFLNLLYPRLCVACKEPLHGYEKDLCTMCYYHLPKTRFLSVVDNPVAKLFWGRSNICFASAYCYYSKGGTAQKLIHAMKYQGKSEIGNSIGKVYGNQLKRNDDLYMSDVDLIVPVPLHLKRKRERGYNQSDAFALGLSTALGTQVELSALVKAENTTTQTNKTRIGRWQNVEKTFKVRDCTRFINKHVLLVDDVITTGATLEACANVILQVPGTRVSVLGIAVAA